MQHERFFAWGAKSSDWLCFRNQGASHYYPVSPKKGDGQDNSIRILSFPEAK